MQLPNQLRSALRHYHQYVDIDGCVRTHIPVGDNVEGIQLPQRLAIPLYETYRILDGLSTDSELPVIDTESVMQALVDILGQDFSDNQVHRCAKISEFARNILMEFGPGMNNPLLRMKLEKLLAMALDYALVAFRSHCLYINHVLYYDYERRDYGYSAILVRKQRIRLE